MYSIFHFSPVNSVQIVDSPRGSLCSFIPLSRFPPHPSLIPRSSLAPHGRAGQTLRPTLPEELSPTKVEMSCFYQLYIKSHISLYIYIYIHYIILLLFKPKRFANFLLPPFCLLSFFLTSYLSQSLTPRWERAPF